MEFNEFFSQNANEKKTLTDFQIKEGFGYLVPHLQEWTSIICLEEQITTFIQFIISI